MRRCAGLVLAAAFAQLACGPGTQTQSEQDRQAEEYAKSFGVDVDVKTNGDGTQSVAVDRSVGGVTAQAGGNLSVPAGFPDDVPLYPQINLASASQMPGLGFMLQGQAPDAIDKVASFYASEMKAKGWAQAASQQNSAMSLLQFKKGDRAVTLILIPGNGGTTTVQLMTTPVG